eukprot:1343308-Pyramimonas_sp.AAC.2
MALMWHPCGAAGRASGVQVGAGGVPAVRGGRGRGPGGGGGGRSQPPGGARGIPLRAPPRPPLRPRAPAGEPGAGGGAGGGDARAQGYQAVPQAVRTRD